MLLLPFLCYTVSPEEKQVRFLVFTRPLKACQGPLVGQQGPGEAGGTRALPSTTVEGQGRPVGEAAGGGWGVLGADTV